MATPDYSKIRVSERKTISFIKLNLAWNPSIPWDSFMKKYDIQERQKRISDPHITNCTDEDGNFIETEKAVLLLEKCEFELAEHVLFATGSIAAHQSFLSVYPRSPFADETRNRIDISRELEKSTTIAQLNEFKSKHPDWDSLADQKLKVIGEKDYFLDAKQFLIQQRDAALMAEFCKRYPYSSRVAEAQNLMRELEDFKKAESPQELEVYLADYPGGQFVKETRDKLNHLDSLRQQHQMQADISIFISYSRTDEKLRKELAKHLIPIRGIRTWTDLMIEPGDNWHERINTNIDDCDIVMMLLSADFLASDFCKTEYARAREKGKVILPVVMRPCLWQNDIDITNIQVLPKDGKPLTVWEDQDSAYVNIAQGVTRVVERLRAARFTRNN